MLNKLFTLTYNNTEVLQQLQSEAEIYLEENDDILIKDLCLVCKSLIVLSQTKDIVAARVWIYVNILDIKKLSLCQNGIQSWSVLYPAKPVK